MKFSFSLKVNASKEKIWNYYEDINKWFSWEKDLENITLNGSFEKGSKGTMKLKGMPEIVFELSSVVKNKEFVDVTNMPMGSIYFYHNIFEKDGENYIEHSVELKNAEVTLDNTNFLSKLFSDVPKAMFLIRDLAEKDI